MTPTLISLIGLILAFGALVLWVWNPKSKDRWEEAEQLPFESNATPSRKERPHD